MIKRIVASWLLEENSLSHHPQLETSHGNRRISLTKLAELSSPLLMQLCSSGKTIPKAKLELMRADSDGKPVKYYEVELENVLIGGVHRRACNEEDLFNSWRNHLVFFLGLRR